MSVIKMWRVLDSFQNNGIKIQKDFKGKNLYIHTYIYIKIYILKKKVKCEMLPSACQPESSMPYCLGLRFATCCSVVQVIPKSCDLKLCSHAGYQFRVR